MSRFGKWLGIQPLGNSREVGGRMVPLLMGVVGAFFLFYAGRGLTAGFAPDDMMNLHGYWAKGWGEALLDLVRFDRYRPMGALYYLPLHAIFGLNPFPFRLVCLLLLTMNLGIFAWFTVELTGRRQTALIAVALGAVHPALQPLYFNNSTIYELLCYGLFYATLAGYIRIRRQGRLPAAGETLLLLGGAAAALNAKEMAVLLPLLTGGWEFLRHRPAGIRGLPRWLAREGRFTILLAALSAVFAAVKAGAADSILGWHDYAPSLTASQYFHTSRAYMTQIFHHAVRFNSLRMIALWAGLLGLAAWRRSVPLAIALLIGVAGLLPVNFVPMRGGHVLYLPLAGWTICGALFLEWGVERVFRKSQRSSESRLAIGMTIAFLLMFFSTVLSPERHEPLLQAQRRSASTIEAFRDSDFLPAPGTCTLVTESPHKKDWDMYFITRLVYNDRSLGVSLIRDGNVVGDCAGEFDYRIALRGGRLIVDSGER